MPDITSLPFNPLRTSLYSTDELFAGFSETDVASYGACPDIKILSYFVAGGKNPKTDSGASTLEALHDNSISVAVQALLASRRRVSAIMGGHGMARNDPAYAGVARLAYQLASAGFLVASGGGPGAMEAAHLGALLSALQPRDLDAAILELATAAPKLPDARNLVDQDGRVNPTIAADVHRWFAPAFRLSRSLFPAGTISPCESLAVPTWLYGYEPTTPFATHVAKYFQNSLREDGLVTLGTSGIVYAEGTAGTVQEIFQDASQNCYGDFCPMVFLSTPGTDYWSKMLPVRPLVEAILGKKSGYASRVLFTEDPAAAVDFLVKLNPL